MTENKVITVLGDKGPLTGAQLQEQTLIEVFPLWQVCRRSRRIHLQTIGKRFLRLDRAIEGYARLSPSIRREFMTYTVLGLKNQLPTLKEIAGRLEEEIREISRAKFRLAQESMAAAVSPLAERDLIREKTCFIISGDITYGMAHTVSRPEVSTGKMVRGSDLDIVVVADDALPEKTTQTLDRALHDRKYFLLAHPDYQEEIDYLIKPLSRLRQQLRFDTFASMVACKNLWEGEYLYGSFSLFQTAKELMDEYEIPAKLRSLEARARRERETAEIFLLQLPSQISKRKFYHLFYTQEERMEDFP